ncbi:hypothetical protein [Geopseudomonas aromaticivorans]
MTLPAFTAPQQVVYAALSPSALVAWIHRLSAASDEQRASLSALLTEKDKRFLVRMAGQAAKMRRYRPTEDQCRRVALILAKLDSTPHLGRI